VATLSTAALLPLGMVKVAAPWSPVATKSLGAAASATVSFTVRSYCTAGFALTVNLAGEPSVTGRLAAGATVITGSSLVSVMAMATWLGLPAVTAAGRAPNSKVSVSVGSSILSVRAVKVSVPVVVPAETSMLPLFDRVKSAAVALPVPVPAERSRTGIDTLAPGAAVSVAVTVTVPPSATVAALALRLTVGFSSSVTVTVTEPRSPPS